MGAPQNLTGLSAWAVRIRRLVPCSVAAVLVVCSLCGSGGTSIGKVSVRAVNALCPALKLGVHSGLTLDGDRKLKAGSRVLYATCSTRGLLATHFPDRIERKRGQRDWSVTDSAIDKLAEVDIEPLFVLLGSPSWANGVPADVPEHQQYVPAEPKRFATWLSAFTDFAYDAALRYKGRVHRWEIWNEPNLAAFWRPRPTVDQYAEVYARLRAAILCSGCDCEGCNGGRGHRPPNRLGQTGHRRVNVHSKADRAWDPPVTCCCPSIYDSTPCPGCRVSGTKQLR